MYHLQRCNHEQSIVASFGMKHRQTILGDFREKCMNIMEVLPYFVP